MTAESNRKAWFHYALAIFVTLIFVLPLIAMLVTSLRDPAKAAAGFSLLPDALHWQNYVEAWRATNFPRQFINSLAMALGVTAGQIITSLGLKIKQIYQLVAGKVNLPDETLHT